MRSSSAPDRRARRSRSVWARRRPQDRDHRAQSRRRNLRQQWLHPDQDLDRERARRACRPPRRGLRRDDRRRRPRRHAPRQGAQGCDRAAVEPGRRRLAAQGAQRDLDRRPRALRGTAYDSRRRYVLEAGQIFINVGGRAAVPPTCPGLREVPYFTNSSMMEVDFLPEHLVDRRRQLHRPRIRPDVPALRQPRHRGRDGAAADRREDDDVSAAVQTMLEAEGIAFRLNATCLDVSKRGDGMAVHVSCEDERAEVEGSHLLLAVGRVPNTHDLGLDKAGVASTLADTSTSTIRCATNVPGIWALGDCQRPGRVHPYLLQRFRDRRGQPARRRSARVSDRSRPTPCSSIRRSRASA